MLKITKALQAGFDTAVTYTNIVVRISPDTIVVRRKQLIISVEVRAYKASSSITQDETPIPMKHIRNDYDLPMAVETELNNVDFYQTLYDKLRDAIIKDVDIGVSVGYLTNANFTNIAEIL